MDPFVEQLAALCRTHVTRSKWVFVPTHAIGRTLGDRLVLDGTDWPNLRFVTPLDVALRMGAPFLVERGIDPSEEELGPALMMRLLLAPDLRASARRRASPVPYFRRSPTIRRWRRRCGRTVRELRMAGVKPDALKADAFASPAKHAELVALLASYEQFLTRTTAGTWRPCTRRPCSIRTGVRSSPRTAGPSCLTSPGLRCSGG